MERIFIYRYSLLNRVQRNAVRLINHPSPTSSRIICSSPSSWFAASSCHRYFGFCSLVLVLTVPITMILYRSRIRAASLHPYISKFLIGVFYSPDCNAPEHFLSFRFSNNLQVSCFRNRPTSWLLLIFFPYASQFTIYLLIVGFILFTIN